MGTTLDVTRPTVIVTEAEHAAALAEVERLMALAPAPGTPEAKQLETWAILIEAYEDEWYPMGEASTPQSAVEFRIEQLDMTRTDLVPILGGRSRVSEFFSGKRPLSMTQVARLRDELGISADLLIPEPKRKPRGKRAPRRSR